MAVSEAGLTLSDRRHDDGSLQTLAETLAQDPSALHTLLEGEQAPVKIDWHVISGLDLEMRARFSWRRGGAARCAAAGRYVRAARHDGHLQTRHRVQVDLNRIWSGIRQRQPQPPAFHSCDRSSLQGAAPWRWKAAPAGNWRVATGGRERQPRAGQHERPRRRPRPCARAGLQHHAGRDENAAQPRSRCCPAAEQIKVQNSRCALCGSSLCPSQHIPMAFECGAGMGTVPAQLCITPAARRRTPGALSPRALGGRPHAWRASRRAGVGGEGHGGTSPPTARRPARLISAAAPAASARGHAAGRGERGAQSGARCTATAAAQQLCLCCSSFRRRPCYTQAAGLPPSGFCPTRWVLHDCEQRWLCRWLCALSGPRALSDEQAEPDDGLMGGEAKDARATLVALAAAFALSHHDIRRGCVWWLNPPAATP